MGTKTITMLTYPKWDGSSKYPNQVHSIRDLTSSPIVGGHRSVPTFEFGSRFKHNHPKKVTLISRIARYICIQHECLSFMVYVGKYTSPMDPMSTLFTHP